MGVHVYYRVTAQLMGQSYNGALSARLVVGSVLIDWVPLGIEIYRCLNAGSGKAAQPKGGGFQRVEIVPNAGGAKKGVPGAYRFHVSQLHALSAGEFQKLSEEVFQDSS